MTSTSSAGERVDAREPFQLIATPFVWRDPKSIPCRDFLYGRHLMRGYASATVAPGGVGKTALKIATAMEMASGRDLLKTGRNVVRRKVWLWNLEDPKEELERRIAAAAIFYELAKEDLEGWLFVDSGRDQPCVIARETRHGAVIVEPVTNAIVAQIIANDVEVLIIDPFVSSHAVKENDNVQIDLVAKGNGRPSR